MNRSEAVTLIDFNHCANWRLLRKASRLPSPALRAQASLNDVSIVVSLGHILDTQWYWREAAQFRAVPLMTLSEGF